MSDHRLYSSALEKRIQIRDEVHGRVSEAQTRIQDLQRANETNVGIESVIIPDIADSHTFIIASEPDSTTTLNTRQLQSYSALMRYLGQFHRQEIIIHDFHAFEATVTAINAAPKVPSVNISANDGSPQIAAFSVISTTPSLVSPSLLNSIPEASQRAVRQLFHHRKTQRDLFARRAWLCVEKLAVCILMYIIMMRPWIFRLSFNFHC